MLEVGKKRHVHCKNNRAEAIWEDAKLRGVDFRAVGNEPGWHLELTAGERLCSSVTMERPDRNLLPLSQLSIRAHGQRPIGFKMENTIW